MLNAFTVDVEDYFHVQSFADRICPADWDQHESRVVRNTERLLAILAEHGVRGTFFILGWVADRYPQLVREIHDAGHEIGCHGFYHGLIYRMTPDEFREDLLMGAKAVEEIIGQRVEAFRAPSFSITQQSLWALDILIEEGFRYDSSIFPVYHDHYGIPDAQRFPYAIPYGNGGPGAKCQECQEPGVESQQPPPDSHIPPPASHTAHPASHIAHPASRITHHPSPITHHPSRTAHHASRTAHPAARADEPPASTAPHLYEFPPTVYRRWGLNIPVAGGGYFRLYPFALTRRWLGRINAVERQPFVFYIHPWELDPDQPRLPAKWKSRFRHYQNLRHTERKLNRLLSTFRFGTLSQCLCQIGLGAEGNGGY